MTDLNSETFKDALHDALADGYGCKHPKFGPWQCRVVASRLALALACDDCGRTGSHDPEVEH